MSYKGWIKEFKEPKNVGVLDGVTGEAGGVCSDFIRLYIEIENNMIKDTRFLATGCPAAIASASALTQLIKGKTLFDAAKVSGKTITEWLSDLPEEKQRCADLAALALARAIENYCSKTDIPSLPLNNKRVFIGLSGGVDSATAAYLLKQEGYEVVGVTARIFESPVSGKKSCCNPKDIADAKSVCEHLDLPHLVLDMRKEFKQEVIDRFCRLYLEGKTPNPCVDCNRFFRFKELLGKARMFGARYLATGHYVRLEKNDGTIFVKRGRDRKKDQSYLFWAATQEVLKSFLTPLGKYTKDEVRKLALELGLPVAYKEESQDICFIPEGDYVKFLINELNLRPEAGLIVNTNGEVLGKHRGFFRYTIGQRKGLRLSLRKPAYVCSLDAERNLVVVGYKEELLKKRFKVEEFNFITGKPPSRFEADVMLRYNSTLHRVTVEMESEKEAVVIFDKPAGPVSPGQSAVFYDGELLLGGGIIQEDDSGIRIHE